MPMRWCGWLVCMWRATLDTCTVGRAVWTVTLFVPAKGRGEGVGWIGVFRHSVYPSQGRPEERARVAWRGVMGLAWILVRVPTDEKTYAGACDVSAAAA